MQLVNPVIEEYAWQHTSKESDLLRKLRIATDEKLEYSEMLSGRVEGRLLQMLIQLGGFRRVLELGTFTGYSALSMAEVLPDDGEIITCEYNERYERIARRFIKQHPRGDQVHIRMGDAMQTLEELSGSFDLAFVDADKANYPAYYEKILPMIRSGGLIVIDNAFWSGEVLEPADRKSKAIDELNRIIRKDSRVDNVMLTVRDGIHIARKK